MESSSKETKCDECEKWKKDIVICLECVETVCLECDTRIHNKGMRIHHHRVPFHPNLFEDKSNPKFRISYFARQCYRNNFSNRRDFNEEVRKYTYEKLLESTRRGIPMLLLKDLMEYLMTRFGSPREDILVIHRMYCLVYWILKMCVKINIKGTFLT